MLQVKHLLETKGNLVYSIGPDQPVLAAIHTMADKFIGALLVMQGDVLVGMLSERDYARKCVLKGRASVGTMVREIMSSPAISVNSKMSVQECLSLITDRHLRHLPVLEDNQLVGLVSIGDLVKETIAEQEQLIRQLEEYIRG